ncbi:MAG: enoyl-CoA hydratase-related protein [Hyphomonadaceae bacterium]
MPYETILVAQRDSVTHITLNRPLAMNAVTQRMHDELQAAFDVFAGDAAQRICVLQGAGERAFCAGSDLKEIAAIGSATYPKNGYAGLIERFDLYKPVIAAVRGVCLGGGFEIALACDLIIATEDSSFGLPEPLIGSMAVGGGVHRLVRQIGMKRAMGYILSSARISAAEAYAAGLLNEVTAPEALDESVARWCAKILRGAPLALSASKEAAMRGLAAPSLEAAIKGQSESAVYRTWRNSEDTKEGARAFAEKRPPVWRGQ